jgi:uncharacterized repeat protein (TIGR01451 family)
MWTIQEFCDATNSYGVRVVKLIAPPPATPNCAAPAPVTTSTQNVTITGISSSGSGFFDPGVGFPNRLQASVSGGVTVNSVTFNSPTSVTLNVTATSNGLKSLTITNPDGQSIAGSNCINVSLGAVLSADLSITKTDGQTTDVPGTSITYTIVASNAGPSSANGATVADTVPAAITGATWTCAGAGGGTCTASGSGNINDTVNLPVGGSVTYTLTGTVSPSATGSLSNTATVTAPSGVTDPNPANNSATDTDTLLALNYFTLPPCRVVDTRGGAPIGGPVLQGQETRTFAVAGNCGISPTAKAISINLAVTQSTAAGNVRLFPAGQAVPTISSINYAAGQTRANNAIVVLNPSGALAAFVGQVTGTTVHLIIDVNGYFE